MTAVLECPDRPIGGGGMTFLGVYAASLYDAAGDPNIGAAGVWLGSNVNPNACFTSGAGIVTASDIDGDGLANHCEFPIARSFAPMLHYANGESCPNGEPYWATKSLPNGRRSHRVHDGILRRLRLQSACG